VHSTLRPHSTAGPKPPAVAPEDERWPPGATGSLSASAERFPDVPTSFDGLDDGRVIRPQRAASVFNPSAAFALADKPPVAPKRLTSSLLIVP